MSTTAASTSQQSGKPRSFQYKKSPNPLPRPEGEPSEFKEKVLRQWSAWVSEYDRKNAAHVARLASEHPVVWRATPRTPCVQSPLDGVEQRAFASGHLLSHRSYAEGKPSNNVAQPAPPKNPRKKHFTTAAKSWRDGESKATHVQTQPEEGEEEILWATEETGVGLFDAEGKFKFVSDAVMTQESGPKEPLAKNVLFGAAASATIPSGREWYYKDPRGHVQGPFTSAQMLDWYSRGFFPESLPLRLSDGTAFESLAVLKIRSEGKCPFEPLQPPGYSTPLPREQPALRFGMISSSDDPIVNVPVRKPAAQSVVEPETKATNNVGTVSSHNAILEPVDEAEEQKKFLEGLMLKKGGSHSNGPKLAQIMATQAVELKAKYEPRTEPAPSANPTVASPAWKLVTNVTAVPLGEIQKQQEGQERGEKQEKQPVKTPKSFADLIADSTLPKPAPTVVKKPAPIQPVAAFQPAGAASRPLAAQPLVKTDPLKDWMSVRLKPYNVDSGFLYSLLSDCRTAEEAAFLLRDNLLQSDPHDADLHAFSKEYLKRRFGAKSVSQHIVDVVCPRPMDDRDERPEAEFSTVSRRKK